MQKNKTIYIAQLPQPIQEAIMTDVRSALMDIGPRERIIFELKGHKGSNDIKLGDQDSKNTVRWFFRRTFPFAKKYYSDADKPNQYPLKACYITTARFSDEALETLNKLNESNLKPSLLDVYYDGQKLIKFMKELEYKKELDALEKYYL